MDLFTIEDLRGVLELSSVCIGLFNEKTSRITAPNQALRNRLSSDEASVLRVASDEGMIYGRLQKEGIPVSLRILSTARGEDGPCSIVEVSLAHSTSTRDKSPNSDLIQLVDTTSDGVWEWFPSLQYEFMSARFWGILGYDHRHMPNSPDAWMGIINPTDLALAMKMFNDHVATRGVADYNCNVAYTHKDGHQVNVKCRGAVVEWLPDGVPWRMLGTHTDITNIKKGVEEKAQLVSRLSHEIRTPICAILNECETLEANTATSIINDGCEQLLALCNDMLTADKLHGPMEIGTYMQSTSVEDFFQKFVRRHAIQASKAGLTVEHKLRRLPPSQVMMDVSKCNQVIDNLASNAIKYTPAGGRLYLELICRSPKALIGAECSTPGGRNLKNIVGGKAGETQEVWQVEFNVKDTGKGIHSDDKEFVFSKFSQANSSMEGAGLGLSISKDLARLMSGDVFLKDTAVGGGSTFTFNFPAALATPAPEDKTSPASGEEEQAVRRPSQRRRKISTIRLLSADDMLTNRKVMRRRLRGIEEQLDGVTIEVVDARDGKEAVSLFRDGGGFDLVFMDCIMPDMDGFEAAKQIHRVCEDFGIDPVPVVAVTAGVSASLYEKCREAGMSRVITKPFAAMDVVPILQSVIDATTAESDIESPAVIPRLNSVDPVNGFSGAEDESRNALVGSPPRPPTS